jgi:hypothetical protein
MPSVAKTCVGHVDSSTSKALPLEEITVTVGPVKLIIVLCLLNCQAQQRVPYQKAKIVHSDATSVA